MIEHVNQLITKELDNYEAQGIEPDEYLSEVKDIDGRQTIVYGKKSHYGKLLDLRSYIKGQELYNQKQFKNYNLSNYDVEQDFQKIIKEKAINFINKPSGLFYISGQSGSGKTHICTAIIKNLLIKFYKVEYIVWQDEMERIKSLEYNERKAEVDKLSKAEVLYIDDFLKTTNNDRAISDADLRITNNIINYRYNHDSITIISSELDYNAVKKIDASLAGRIIEMTYNQGDSNIINIGYKDNRNYRERYAPKAI